MHNNFHIHNKKYSKPIITTQKINKYNKALISFQQKWLKDYAINLPKNLEYTHAIVEVLKKTNKEHRNTLLEYGVRDVISKAKTPTEFKSYLLSISKQIKNMPPYKAADYLINSVSPLLYYIKNPSTFKTISNHLAEIPYAHKSRYIAHCLTPILKNIGSDALEKYSSIIFNDIKNSKYTSFETYLKYEVQPLLYLKPNPEQLKVVLDYLRTSNILTPLAFIENTIRQLLYTKPTITNLKQDLFLINKIIEKKFNQNIFINLHIFKEYLNNRKKNYTKINKYIDSLKPIKAYKWNSKDLNIFKVWELTSNITHWRFKFNLSIDKFISLYNKHKDFNEPPILNVFKNKKNISFNTIVSKHREVRLKKKAKLNEKLFKNYLNLFDITKRTPSERFITVLMLANPSLKKRVISERYIQKVKTYSSQDILSKTNSILKKVISEKKYDLVQPILEQISPFILKQNNIFYNYGTTILSKYEYLNKLIDSYDSVFKNYLYNHLSLSYSEKREIDKCMKLNKIENEINKFENVKGSINETIEFKATRNVLDIFAGLTGETCLTFDYNPSYMRNKNVQILTMVNKKSQKPEGAVYTQLEKISGKKCLVITGIEPKLGLMDIVKNEVSLCRSIIDAIKEISKINKIDTIYLADIKESGYSDRTNVAKYLMETYVQNKPSITHFMHSPSNLHGLKTEISLYKI